MKIKYSIALLTATLMFSSCEKFLDRPQLTSANDDNAWTTEENVRLYANKYYTDFFEGYGSGFSLGSSYLLSFSDDVVRQGNQAEFTLAVPNSGIWSYTNIRSINIMLDRVETRMSTILTPEAYNHWIGIGRFFRAMAYSDLVLAYGDVPYYDKPVSDTDFDALFKNRTPRNEVMDAVYEDLKFALENVRLSDGVQSVNRYVVAGFISRIALSEGSWQKYYYENDDQAKKFFELALEAGELVISSSKYDIVTDYRSQFTSENLSGNKDMILYREYNESINVKHALLSTHNLADNVTYGPSSDLIKSFICVDGSVWQNSSETNANNFVTSQLFKTRDSRFEAVFHEKPTARNRGSFLYITKFLPRDVEARVAAGGAAGTAFTGANNTTDAPVLRYAEVLLNWIEAKAELSTLGAAAVDQSDIDRSINKIRNRPLAAEAIQKGVKKTAPMTLGMLPSDPERDVTISPLMWEIRRERRMEMTFEFNRLADLKRWKKLDYMDTDANPDLLAGGWVDFPNQIPGEIKSGISVVKLNGQIEVFNPDNPESAAKMVGFYRYSLNRSRQQFLGLGNVNPYLSPIGRNQINEYQSRGYVLSQTEGWAQN
ncbi:MULTISPECIES: RagB/SusD family nutrient uptake outer membrane protein [Sphingobacterium]|uniref:RagB/SusD family nutrient uptake outer membrane protein n=1 Tax=Sphingobacterium litopenaei TaxID=2763500 RepID=A0ABR7YHA9_9SPHI|nr:MULTISPECIES: RagB/SusD family nutrient uptake outer membrane protein [Sphingobacterium]MBD1430656.1 RagB/SusD family nutrient uptake outer membrane protein [Sphingobacterium litopenaei]